MNNERSLLIRYLKKYEAHPSQEFYITQFDHFQQSVSIFCGKEYLAMSITVPEDDHP
jgi:hypothetical protein